LRGGKGRRLAEVDSVQKAEKSFRETLNPLKSLKIAKSEVLGDKGYQPLSKTHDFAGETISFRIASLGLRFWFRAKCRTARRGGAGEHKNLENPPIRGKSFLRANH
jgi:hypothetical protein